MLGVVECLNNRVAIAAVLVVSILALAMSVNLSTALTLTMCSRTKDRQEVLALCTSTWWDWTGSLTFSNPKNLSVPSSRTGPALCNSFSTGVKSSGGSSFLFLVDAVLSDFEIPWTING